MKRKREIPVSCRDHENEDSLYILIDDIPLSRGSRPTRCLSSQQAALFLVLSDPLQRRSYVSEIASYPFTTATDRVIEELKKRVIISPTRVRINDCFRLNPVG